MTLNEYDAWNRYVRQASGLNAWILDQERTDGKIFYYRRDKQEPHRGIYFMLEGNTVVGGRFVNALPDFTTARYEIVEGISFLAGPDAARQMMMDRLFPPVKYIKQRTRSHRERDKVHQKAS